MASRFERNTNSRGSISLVDRRSDLGQLPRPLTSLVGRDAEVAVIVNRLTGDAQRLITLTGPGGVGKTRLAIAVAEAVRLHFTHGVSFIPLAAVTTPELIAPAIVTALGIPSRADHSAEQVLIDGLRHRHLLIVLDNFEHVLDAAPIVSRLLQQAPDLSVAVTSLVALRIGGETLVRVSTLSVPETRSQSVSLATLDDTATAVRLFAERAIALDASFALTGRNAETVTAICRQLDGLPLAIELAVARLPAMTPAMMLERLTRQDQRLPLLTDGMRDAPERFRTMGGAISWSYDLLPPEGQQLFRVLSSFTGGCTWDALEMVATAVGISTGALTDLLSDLIEHSLVVRRDTGEETTRYGMLETIREFGLAQLAETGDEDVVRDAHAAWCAQFARVNERDIHTGLVRHRLTMDRARAEIPNLRSALDWTISRNEAERALAISGASAFAWSLMHMWAEGAAWIEGARSLPTSGDADPTIRLWATSSLARLYVMLAEYDRARVASQDADALMTLADVPVARAYAGWMRGVVRAYSGDVAGGISDCAAAQCAFVACAEPDLALAAACSAARATASQGAADAPGARMQLEGVLTLVPLGSHDFVRGMTLSVLARLELAAGDRAQAKRYMDEAAPIVIDMGEFWLLAIHVENLAELEAADHPAWSFTILLAIGAWRSRVSFPGTIVERQRHRQELDRIRAALNPAEHEAARLLGASMSMPEVIAFALNPSWRRREVLDIGPALTSREREVLRLVVDGASDKEIAAMLAISRRTASRHVAAILAKLDVGTRTAAATLAIREGILESPT